MAHIQESGEMYLEHILVLTKRGGIVRATDVAQEAGYSKPSVSRAMGLLRTAGYIEVGADGGITLTEAGYTVASTILERHTILTDLFERLGVPAVIAAQDACKIEHDVSPETFAALKALNLRLKQAD